MKNARHQQILELIQKYEIETQEELADYLRESGFNTTQATVSRDIRQLSLKKVTTAGGRQKYAIGGDGTSTYSVRYRRVLKESFVSLDISMNTAVIKTASGMAMAAAAAIDSMDWEEVLGCIAGDDTIIVVLRSPDSADGFRNRMLAATKEEGIR